MSNHKSTSVILHHSVYFEHTRRTFENKNYINYLQRYIQKSNYDLRLIQIFSLINIQLFSTE